jgi:hypothetical protein
MKTLLVPLLLLSLAGNAVLAFFALRPASTADNPATATAASTKTAGLAPAGSAPANPADSTGPAGTTAAPVNWQTLNPGRDLHGLVANLRAAGFPPSVVRAVVSQMITDRLSGAGTEHLPFWKQNANNSEFLTAQQQQLSLRREMMSELLGADARPSASMDPVARERRYGSLSDEKVDQVDAITRDFNDMRSKLFADRKPGDPQGMMTTQLAMEQELQKELASVLTPAELEQYEMRSSQSASRLMSNLKDVEVSEAEYAALFRAQKALDAADPVRAGVVTPDAMALRAAAQEELNAQARAVLTDDRFYEYLKSADSTYARTAQFTTSYPNITPAMTYELTQIERDYQTAMMTASQGGSGSARASDRMARITAARNAYQEKVAALLGPETATAYAQRNRPGGTTILPAVRIGP